MEVSKTDSKIVHILEWLEKLSTLRVSMMWQLVELILQILSTKNNLKSLKAAYI
jgi:hypothetical protein